MRVQLLVTFEVEAIDDGEDLSELTEGDAKSAASLAAWHNLVLTDTGELIVEETRVHVDGFGPCRVRVGDEHE